MIKRVILLVLDGCGIGTRSDVAAYGDAAMDCADCVARIRFCYVRLDPPAGPIRLYVDVR
ncbi:MAG: hypothetical protein JNN16_08080 [Nitrospira sp.]|nr:hypothetical protein [Nitrospira sp.]